MELLLGAVIGTLLSAVGAFFLISTVIQPAAAGVRGMRTRRNAARRGFKKKLKLGLLFIVLTAIGAGTGFLLLGSVFSG